MAKKGNGFGKLVAFATIAGAVAAGISCLLYTSVSRIYALATVLNQL